MLVKYRTYDEGWAFVNADKQVSVRLLEKEQVENLLENYDEKAILNFAVDNRTSVKLIRIDNDTLLYTDRNVYLLNNNGKTVETLY